jgi:hypothetical protein
VKKRYLLRHRGLISEPFFGTPITLNPDVAASGAVIVEMPLAIHDQRGNAHTPETRAVRAPDGRDFLLFVALGIIDGHESL